MKRPKVGILVAIRQGDLVLLGKRRGRHAPGLWQFPGGHLEGGESFAGGGIRETEEETGIILPAAYLWTVVNTIYHLEKRHYVCVILVADMPAGQEPRVMEPEKCEQWGWYRWDQLPAPLAPSTEQLVTRGLNPIILETPCKQN